MVLGMVGVPLIKDKGEKMQRQRQKQKRATAKALGERFGRM
jgi:hypothetical protein